MIAERSDRLYSADVLVSTKPMAGYCLSSPQPVVTAPRAP